MSLWFLFTLLEISFESTNNKPPTTNHQSLVSCWMKCSLLDLANLPQITTRLATPSNNDKNNGLFFKSHHAPPPKKKTHTHDLIRFSHLIHIYSAYIEHEIIFLSRHLLPVSPSTPNDGGNRSRCFEADFRGIVPVGRFSFARGPLDFWVGSHCFTGFWEGLKHHP